MSTIYKSAVPLAMVRTIDGGYQSVYEGEPIAGESVDPDTLERLTGRGWLVEAPPEDDGDAGPPAKSASKGDWEAYARSQGATDEDLDGVTKDDLVAEYGG